MEVLAIRVRDRYNDFSRRATVRTQTLFSISCLRHLVYGYLSPRSRDLLDLLTCWQDRRERHLRIAYRDNIAAIGRCAGRFNSYDMTVNSLASIVSGYEPRVLAQVGVCLLRMVGVSTLDAPPHDVYCPFNTSRGMQILLSLIDDAEAEYNSNLYQSSDVDFDDGYQVSRVVDGHISAELRDLTYGIWKSHQFERLPMLADRMERQGFTFRHILDHLRQRPEEPCSRCRGSGKIYFDSYNYESCHMCGGAGLIFHYHGLSCQVLNGIIIT